MTDTHQQNKSSSCTFRGSFATNVTATITTTTKRGNDSASELTITQAAPSSTSDSSNVHSPNDSQAGDAILISNNHQSKYKNISLHPMDSHHHYHDLHSKHLKKSRWSGFWTLVNSFALMIALIIQGSLMNYYLIYFNQGRAEWYFLFFCDFVILVMFLFAITFAWRFYKGHRNNTTVNTNELRDATTIITVDHVRFGSGIFGFSFPKPMGMLPLIYICWIAYALNITVKMYIMYSLRIPEAMVQEAFKAPKEIILITLAISVAVFLFWIEAHWNLGDERQRHLSKPSVDDLISHTAFELFDSLTFLDLVTPDDKEELENDDANISFAMKMIVLSFASVNFILPTLGLYRMSRTHFGEKTYGIIRVIDESTGKPSTRGLGVSITYHLLRIIAVNVPYMVIRIVLSTSNSKKELSIFIVKNILGILVSVRNLIPEIKEWLHINKFKSKLRSQMPKENGNSNGNRIRIKLDSNGKFDPINQTWELPTIFESKTINSNATTQHLHTQDFGTSTFTNESSGDVGEMDTGTTTSSPSMTFSSSPTKSSETNT